MSVSLDALGIYICGQMGAAGMALPKPANSVLPVITGTLTVGSVLTASTGTWIGAAPIVYSYQWKVAGVNVGTNQNTYTTVAGDATKTVTVDVTASNPAGSTLATSAAVGPIV
jgi:hypothetical protein